MSDYIMPRIDINKQSPSKFHQKFVNLFHKYKPIKALEFILLYDDAYNKSSVIVA